jgi:adenine-specific DNA methylase
MADHQSLNESEEADDSLPTTHPLKIEGMLPVTAVGIESLKEANPEVMSPHRKIYKWFARRPTAASRLAILASVLPNTVSDDQLLEWMCVGPKEGVDGSIEDYVVRKQSETKKSGSSVSEHFGYTYPLQNIPSERDLEGLHDTLRNQWDGSLPTILDPTAGGGTIPLESLRYGLPTISNELNPVAWLLNKVILDYAPSVGSLENEVRQWMDEILDYASGELEEYFPKRGGIAPSYYFRAYSISCPSCGKRFPLTNRWWFNRRVNKAVQFEIIDDDELEFSVVDPDSIEGFDPSDGTVAGGDAECPHCGVVTERDDLVEIFQNEEFEYEVCGVRYEKKIDGTAYHSPKPADYEAVEKAREKVESDLNLATLLNVERFEGHWDRAYPYGVEKWRDVFSSRQLLSHAMLLQAFRTVEPQIKEQYNETQAEVILVILSLIGTKLINRNSRLEPIDASYGCPNSMLGNNGYFFQWHFGESNLTVGNYSYPSEGDNILDNYEDVVKFVSHVERNDTLIHQGDAAYVPYGDESVDAAVMDPPYGDNIVYSEMADAFYVWLKEYIGQTFPETFSQEETDREHEAVENPAAVSDQNRESEKQAARIKYESKMSDIFSEMYRVLKPGGVLTVYFTDKETAAWDALTMGLISSGFTVTATHTITSEMPQRVVTQGSASADSTLLLTCRKPLPSDEQKEEIPTLWSDVQEKTSAVARNKAAELLDSDLNLTKPDMFINAYGPTLRVFTEEYPVVDKHDEVVRPKRALNEAKTAAVEVLVEREFGNSLDGVDTLTTWYILSWLVYGREKILHDEARQLGIVTGVDIDSVKSDTKIWSKSSDKLLLKGQDYRVRDYTKLEAGEKRRKRAYPVDPRKETFDYNIDAVHAAFSVLETKGSDYTWNWLNDRDIQHKSWFERTIKSLLQVLPRGHDDYATAVNLVSGKTGELLDIDDSVFESNETASNGGSRTTLTDFD